MGRPSCRKGRIILMSTSTSSEMGGAWGGSGLAVSPEAAASCPPVSAAAAAAGAAGERPSACWSAVASLLCGFEAGAASTAALGGVWAVFCSAVFFSVLPCPWPGKSLFSVLSGLSDLAEVSGLARASMLGWLGTSNVTWAAAGWAIARQHRSASSRRQAGSGKKNTRDVKKKARDMGSPDGI